MSARVSTHYVMFDPSTTIISDASRPLIPPDYVMKRPIAVWDELCLLMGEIQWIVDHWNPVTDPTFVLIVVGNAPSRHYPILANLFPQMDSINIYTPTPSYETDDSRVVYHRREFSPLDVSDYEGKTVFLSFTMFTPPGEDLAPDRADLERWRQHGLQEQILKAVMPKSALLRFNPPMHRPYDLEYPRTLEYITGTFYGQAFSDPTSQEMFLVPKLHDDGSGYESARFSLYKIQKRMAYYNGVLRGDWNLYDDNGTPIETRWRNIINSKIRTPDEPDLTSDFDSNYLLYVLDKFMSFVGDTETINLNERLVRVGALWLAIKNTLLDTYAWSDRASISQRRTASAFKPGIWSTSEIKDEQLFPSKIEIRPMIIQEPPQNTITETELRKLIIEQA